MIRRQSHEPRAFSLAGSRREKGGERTPPLTRAGRKIADAVMACSEGEADGGWDADGTAIRGVRDRGDGVGECGDGRP